MSKVIVFGPTGNNGSVAAMTAASQGAEVVLAMRNTSKTIPGLSKADEESGKYTRVQADLTDPKSVEHAVKSTGAKRAFAYLAFGMPDHMKSTFEAMKAGGIEFVVFLSSFSIADRELGSVPPNEMIPFVHAQAEASLQAVFGDDEGGKNCVAVRPGGFAVNLLRWKQGILDGNVRIFGEQFEQDCITPGDMGRVSGTILVSGPKNGQKHVYLYSPEIVPQGQACKRIGKMLGKEVGLTPLNEEEGRQLFLTMGYPKPLVDYLVDAMEKSKTRSVDERFTRYREGVENVKLYTGKPAQGLESWVEENKGLFTA